MSRFFGNISQIQPEIKETWASRMFLTFDIDWSCDAVLAGTIDIVEVAGVEATWFVTHASEIIRSIRKRLS